MQKSKVKTKKEDQQRRPVDPALQLVLDCIADMTPREVAEGSGKWGNGIGTWIGASTVYNWRTGRVRQPANYTLDAALRAAGYERVIKRKRNVRG